MRDKVVVLSDDDVLVGVLQTHIRHVYFEHMPLKSFVSGAKLLSARSVIVDCGDTARVKRILPLLIQLHITSHMVLLCPSRALKKALSFLSFRGIYAGNLRDMDLAAQSLCLMI